MNKTHDGTPSDKTKEVRTAILVLDTVSATTGVAQSHRFPHFEMPSAQSIRRELLQALSREERVCCRSIQKMVKEKGYPRSTELNKKIAELFPEELIGPQGNILKEAVLLADPNESGRDQVRARLLSEIPSLATKCTTNMLDTLDSENFTTGDGFRDKVRTSFTTALENPIHVAEQIASRSSTRALCTEVDKQ